MPLYGSGHVVTAAEFNAMFPVGAITPWSTAAAPTGWLLCDGSSLLRAGTYADLFGVIGTAFGSVDGTHFTLPDIRDRFPLAKGTLHSILAAVGGEENHTLTLAESPAHTHTATTSAAGAHSHTYTAPVQSVGTIASSGNQFTDQAASNTGGVADHQHTLTTSSQGSGSAHNNMPPYIVLPYIIRY